MNGRDDLIGALSADLQPVDPPSGINRVALIWLLLSTFYVVAVTHLFGPLRPAALTQLATEPRFLAETLVGVAAIVVTGLAAFRAAIPGALGSRLALASAGLMVIWLLAYVVGLVTPALDPSMSGKRPHCVWETLVYALPPAVVALFLARRLYPLKPMKTAAALGLVSGMIPALYMQLACMYMLPHILLFHIVPGVAVAGVAVALVWLVGRTGYGPVSSNSKISPSS